MLSELGKKAVEADEAVNTFDATFGDWCGILGSSESLGTLLTLDISHESKEILTGIADVAATLEQTNKELETKRDELVLKYALEKANAELGDIIDYVDHNGKSCALIIESAHMFGESVCIYGTRFLKTGQRGVSQGSVSLSHTNWKLRK